MKQKISVALEEDIMEELKILAKKDDRSISNYIEHLLKRKVLPNEKQKKEEKESLA